MNSTDRTNLPPAQPLATSPPSQVPGIDEGKSADDGLFVVKPPEKKPPNKKAIIGVVALTFVGVCILVAVLVFALIASASSLAADYNRLASAQIKKTSKPLADLEPENVLNHRDLTAPLADISLSEQSQPRLENVLFIGGWSSKYVESQKLESQVKAYYDSVRRYAKDIQQAIAFDDTFQKMNGEEAQVQAALNASDSLSIRSVSGSYDQFAQRINKETVPDQIKEVKGKLVKIYQDKAGTYLAWATALEAQDSVGQTKAQQELIAETAKITPLVEDQNYIRLFTPAYKKLLTTQNYLKDRLAP